MPETDDTRISELEWDDAFPLELSDRELDAEYQERIEFGALRRPTLMDYKRLGYQLANRRAA